MPTPSNAFETRNTRLAADKELEASARAEQAGRWLSEAIARKAEANAAEAKCVASAFASDDVADYLSALSQFRDVETVANSVVNHGGPEEVKRRVLATPETFDILGRGYAERAAAIETKIPQGRKPLGTRMAQLTEQGLHPNAILSDPVVARLGGYLNELTAALAAAVAGKKYCDNRGINCSEGNRSWADLYGCLTSPLPAAPVLPATA